MRQSGCRGSAATATADGAAAMAGERSDRSGETAQPANAAAPEGRSLPSGPRPAAPPSLRRRSLRPRPTWRGIRPQIHQPRTACRTSRQLRPGRCSAGAGWRDPRFCRCIAVGWHSSPELDQLSAAAPNGSRRPAPPNPGHQRRRHRAVGADARGYHHTIGRTPGPGATPAALPSGSRHVEQAVCGSTGRARSRLRRGRALPSAPW